MKQHAMENFLTIKTIKVKLHKYVEFIATAA